MGYATDEERNTSYGFVAVPQEEYALAKELGAKTVLYNGRTDSDSLQAALDTAKSLGLTLAARAEGRSRFQTKDNKIDFDKLRSLMSEMFSYSNIASDPAFEYYYIIDEPCHDRKWDITPGEFRKFYRTIKEVDPSIPVMVNFGTLRCFNKFVAPDNETFTDVASFTVTTKKTRMYPDYIDKENQIALSIKEIYPDLKIVAFVAAYEYPDKKVPMPTADWISQVGRELSQYEKFDGIMYYSWVPSSYMGDTIEDVVEESDYIQSFDRVFKSWQ
jgi:hypothetical protein